MMQGFRQCLRLLLAVVLLLPCLAPARNDTPPEKKK